MVFAPKTCLWQTRLEVVTADVSPIEIALKQDDKENKSTNFVVNHAEKN